MNGSILAKIPVEMYRNQMPVLHLTEDPDLTPNVKRSRIV